MAFVIGLTGGIAAGKSTAAKIFADLGAIIIDADAIAREMTRPHTPVWQEIREVFGDHYFLPGGELNRSALGELIFSDPVLREKLNAIVHPAVQARTVELIDQSPSGSVVVHDIPLLVENKSHYHYDLIVTVEAPVSCRLKRLEERGLNPQQAVARIMSQASDEQRRSAADVVLDSEGDIADLRQQIDQLWETISQDKHS